MVFDCRTTNIIRIFDEAGNIIDTHENRRELKSELFFGRAGAAVYWSHFRIRQYLRRRYPAEGESAVNFVLGHYLDTFRIQDHLLVPPKHPSTAPRSYVQNDSCRKYAKFAAVWGLWHKGH
jgi:hypothetical protein